LGVGLATGFVTGFGAGFGDCFRSGLEADFYFISGVFFYGNSTTSLGFY
jgi:hypothetical protein